VESDRGPAVEIDRAPAVEILIGEPALADRVAALLDEAGIRIVDIDDPAADVSITDGLRRRKTARRTIVIAERSDQAEALRGGVAGVLSPAFTPARLLAAIAAVVQGLVVMPDDLLVDALQLLPSAEPAAASGDLAVSLTARELEVLGLVAAGATNKVIARQLDISVHTVKFHIASILTKLDSTGRTDAVAHAVRLGLLML
jgi:DNA-binding NarL/FixJ family response regulator